MTAAFSQPEFRLLAWSGVDLFWFVCLGIVLLQVWRGWRQGVFRQLAVAVGLLAGWVVGETRGPDVIARWWPGTGLPMFILAPLVSLVLGLAVYAGAVLAGRLLFKRACDHSFGPTRLFLGAAGAFVGLFLGLFGVWMLIACVRLAAPILVPPMADTAPPPGEAGPPAQSAPRRGATAKGRAGPRAPALLRIQQSVESGLIGEVVQATDPFPKEVYADLHKIARIATDPSLQIRLFNAPDLRDLASDPKVVALRQDPSVIDALQQKDYLSLLSNPRLRAALDDPKLAGRLEKVDITRVLNETVP